MTLVLYEPEGPALEFIGHAGAGARGQDPVCAALSMLMYTLIEALPWARVSSGEGYCRIEAGERCASRSRREETAAAFRVVLGGLRLLAESEPRHVRLLYRHVAQSKGGKHETGID